MALGAGAVLVAAAAGTAVVWLQWPPTHPEPGVALARLDQPRPVPPEILPHRLPPVPPLIAHARTSAERRIIEEAGALLHRHGELHKQRAAEIAQHGLNLITALHVTVCDRCRTGPSPTIPCCRSRRGTKAVIRS
jgi:hypothetical protein